MSFLSLDNSYNRFDNTYEDLSLSNCGKKDDSICSQLADFEKLRISALTKAAVISPLIKEVTIGPNSPVKKQQNVEEKPKPQKNHEDVFEDLCKEDLRYTLLRKKYDMKLQESTEELFKDLIEKMIANRAEVMTKYWKKQSEESEIRALEYRKRKLLLLKGLKDNDNLSVLEKAKYDEQQSQIKNQQTIENMNRILEEQNKATARFAAITDSHTKVCICYNELTNLLHSDPISKGVYDMYLSSINTVMGNIQMIMEYCKTGVITDKEVKQSEILALNLENIRKKIINEIDDLKQQELKQKEKQQEEAKKKELQEKLELEMKKQQAAIAVETQNKQDKLNKPMFYSSKNYNYYLELKSFLENYESQYKDLLDNANLKKFRFDCQKAVNTPVNALSSVSGMHMRDKYDKLSKLLKGERVQVLDTFVIANQHPQGLYYCTALLAKKIVRQGDLLVSSNPEAAFPLAAVAVALWSQFPTFGKLLEANFHKQCPYLVPMFLPQKEGQTDMEFYLSRGYTYNDEGVVEKQDKFLRRMSGIFRLQCAIWITKSPQFLNTSNPHGLRYGWQWLASFINLRPEPDISATLLHDFFTVCGSEFFKHYGKQFTKIIKLISIDYLKILENIDEGGPKTRLEVFLQNTLKSGQIPPPSGLLPPSTW
ncbi:unnamed protein product [Diatraea saccharalis]|uniref:mRNA export factor GLE1 n=1 Tax=Diatraea saccharalis TaxID=40085 RepID=A0A9N9R4X8_9NEOP|nr:unnamed protein product [Diatraea saccharalis]